MAKYELEFSDLFEGQESVLKKIVEQSLDNDTSRIFDETEKLFEEQLEKVRPDELRRGVGAARPGNDREHRVEHAVAAKVPVVAEIRHIAQNASALGNTKAQSVTDRAA